MVTRVISDRDKCGCGRDIDDKQHTQFKMEDPGTWGFREHTALENTGQRGIHVMTLFLIIYYGILPKA